MTDPGDCSPHASLLGAGAERVAPREIYKGLSQREWGTRPHPHDHIMFALFGNRVGSNRPPPSQTLDRRKLLFSYAPDWCVSLPPGSWLSVFPN